MLCSVDGSWMYRSGYRTAELRLYIWPKEEVVESDPSRLEASVAAVAANFTQYAKIYTEDDNVHSDIGYPTIMLTTESRGTDMVADITGYNWYSNSADYSDCLNTSTATIEFWGTLYNQIFTANNVIGTVR